MIRFENVHKVFDGREVLSGVSFEVKKGEVLAVVGRSGTGKSVTLKHMVKLLRPTSGRVLFEGRDVSSAEGAELASIRERFGYLFQSGALLAWLTVAENVALPLREKNVFSDDEIESRVGEALKDVGLEDAAHLYPSEISGGMAKRAGLARAIVREVDIVLYDEPTSGLDPVTAQSIDELIKRLNRERGITSIVVTHDLPGAVSFADRLLMLKDGKVVITATPEEFLKSSLPEVVEYLKASHFHG